MKYTCPVCAFGELPEPPANYSICPCCGTEFGLDDFSVGHDVLRERWIASGAHWFATDEWPPPTGWNAFSQLARGGMLTRLTGTDTESTLFDLNVQGQRMQPEQIRVIEISNHTLTQRAEAAIS